MEVSSAIDIGDDCAICRVEMTSTSNKSTTVCGHSFHFTCLARSMRTSANCPICRTCLTPPLAPNGETKNDTHDQDDADDHVYDGETDGEEGTGTEEGEIRIPVSSTRPPGRNTGSRRDVIVTEIHETSSSLSAEGHIFGNEVDLRREILEGIIHSICRQGDLAETRHLLNDNPRLLYSRGKTGDLLTHEAVLSENENILSHLLNEKSFDANLPNDVHVYPLHYAVLSGSLRMVTILVNHRAFVDCTDSSKKTPLMIACEEEDHDIAEFLLDRGASAVTQDSSGNKPIHFAVRSRAQACLHRLLSDTDTCDVNAVNHMDETPLFIACKLGFHGVSRTLLRAGADPEKCNKFGRNPLDEASLNGSSSLVDLLRRYV